ncbi:MAG TPA: type VI secretion system tip protein TssI/VgrG, partial [Acetobacteraceae bacterium]|nr:type VI secretion system tip protein TssI/VgrG [Acetobacteraceae bacterium]
GAREGMSDGRNIKERLIELSTPIQGAEKLIGRHLTVREAISRPFLIEVEAFSTKDDIKPDDMVGKTIRATLDLNALHKDSAQPVSKRDFHGVVRSFSRLGHYERGFTAYRFEAVPRAWMKSRTADCRIFQNKTVQQIAEILFGENSGTGSVICQNLPSQPRVYCTQYMETDLDFLQRILDECGACYFFDHSGGQDQIKVIGGDGPFPTCTPSPFPNLTVSALHPSHDRLMQWTPVGAMIPSKVVAYDFDQRHPRKDMKQEASTKIPYAKADHWEMFIWSGGQDVIPGIDVAKLAIETAEAMAETYTCVGRHSAVFAGGKLAVRMGDTSSELKQCIIQGVTHVAYDETHLTGGGTAGYQAELRLQDADRPFRNPTPRARPTMPGLTSALVTGPSGGEIHTDDLGRIKVHFLWDRKGPTNDESSCWVRVMQPFAGAWGGTWFLPRVGDEVVIGFMNGNPDYPVVVGSVYNMDGKPPFTLPGNKTQSGFKTRSSTGGGSDNANILRVDDKKGSEEFYIQAEKDMNILVKNNRDEKVKANHTETITKNRTAYVDQGDEKLQVKMGKMETLVDMGNQSTTVKLGNIATKANLGKQDYEAMQSIELKVGASSIKIDQMGVTIKGMMVKIEGQMMTDVKGMMVNVNGSAMLTLKGGITMIG